MRKTQFPIVKLVRKLRILSFLTQIPMFLRIVGNSAAWGWDMGLKVGIWASRLGFGPQDWNLGLKTGI